MLRCNVAPAGEPQRIGMVESFAWLSRSGLLAVPAMRNDLNVTHVPTGMGIVPARDETEAFALMDALDVIPGWERVSIEGIGNDPATRQAVIEAIASVRGRRQPRAKSEAMEPEA